MAPRSRVSSRQTTKSRNVQTITSLGKVSKAKTTSAKAILDTKFRDLVCEELLAGQEEKKRAISRRVESRQQPSKRKRDESDTEESDRSILQESKRTACVKKLRFQLLTPPHSQHNTDNEASSPEKSTFPARRTLRALPDVLQHWISLHAALLKALSLHFAHNGGSSPAEITSLTTSMTRIWKKSAVSLTDLQRMLAFYELEHANIKHQKLFEHKLSPFKLVNSGFGTASRINLEFCANYGSFHEQNLQDEYEQVVLRMFESFDGDEASAVYQSSNHGPRLSVEVGIQTQSHRLKAASVRAAILSKAENPREQSGPDLSGLSISDQEVNQIPMSVKHRTLSLFDRVRARGIANSATVAPTPEQLTRRHAIGRVPEIVEFLRMKQSQKLSSSSSFLSQEDLKTESVFHNSQAVSRPPTLTRISFSLNQIVREVRESVPVPVGIDEVKVVLKILATELPELNGWVQVIELGSLVSVTLNRMPTNISGVEVGRLLKAKEQTTV